MLKAKKCLKSKLLFNQISVIATLVWFISSAKSLKTCKKEPQVKRQVKQQLSNLNQLNNLNPSFMSYIFQLRLANRPARDKYKLDLEIPKTNQV